MSTKILQTVASARANSKWRASVIGRRNVHAVALSCAVLSSAIAQQPAVSPFTLEQILSSPFPSGLSASPSGGAVTWVLNDRGVRNIWIATAPTFAARRLTSYSEDDGLDITNIEWTANASSIVYVRGGGPNRSGELPNPTSNPEGVDQAIWTVAVEGGTPRKLAEGSAPAVSPRGDQVAYLSRGQIWSVGLDTSAQPVQLIKMRGQGQALRWSPDGSKLAFVSNRTDHAFVGVYELATKTLRFLDPSTDRDGNPAWSPDGARIAYTRIPASRSFFTFGPQRSGEPWSIRIADVKAGMGREAWKAQTGVGSVFQGVAADQQLLWGAGDRVVFPWERDGWTHLYSVPVAGGQATLLTPGAFEVEHIALTSDRASIVYSSNQDDIDRRHLWRVAVSGGTPSRLTRGTGIEWSPVETADRSAIAFLRSDARRPARPAILVAGSERDLAPDTMPKDFPAAALVEPQAVTFTSADGMKIPAQLFVSARAAVSEPRPAVVFFHGGSRRQMLVGWHHSPYYHNAYALNQYLASRGYIVLAVNYRSGIGYGMEFREALAYGAHGASEFNDVVGAGLYLQSRSDVDPKRIGLWGGSYGGYLTALGLARASDMFAAGVDIHGVHDWNVVIRNFSPTYDPIAPQEAARLAFDSSPMAHIDGWRSPVLLIHGDDDRNVPFSETVDLAEALRKKGVVFDQLVFPDEVHSFLRHENWVRAYRATAEFFAKHLERPARTSSSGR
jgi:dipeptidyl aminopeptidase/acylaminoacyl peptidase